MILVYIKKKNNFVSNWYKQKDGTQNHGQLTTHFEIKIYRNVLTSETGYCTFESFSRCVYYSNNTKMERNNTG